LKKLLSFPRHFVIVKPHTEPSAERLEGRQIFGDGVLDGTDDEGRGVLRHVERRRILRHDQRNLRGATSLNFADDCAARGDCAA
jgi:hypothetical protein